MHQQHICHTKMSLIEASSVNKLLFTTFTIQFPQWERFRGAHYDGRATHDPLEENLVSNLLNKGTLGRHLPLNVRQYIGRLTSHTNFKSSRVKILRKVCVSDCDGKRLWKARLYSKQIRRLLDSIPCEGALHKLYTSWTWDVACLVNCSRVEQTLYMGSDMLSASLTHVDRLHVRGFKQLDARDAHVHSRPAYLPSAAKLAEWSAILEKETSMNKKLQIGIQIKEHFKTTHALFEAHAIYGRPMRAGGGTTLINKAAEYCAALHKKLLLSLTEEHILILASQLYTSLYALGLNASERDFVFMLNADREHTVVG